MCTAISSSTTSIATGMTTRQQHIDFPPRFRGCRLQRRGPLQCHDPHLCFFQGVHGTPVIADRFIEERNNFVRCGGCRVRCCYCCGKRVPLSAHQETKRATGQSNGQISQCGSIEYSRRVHRQCVFEFVMTRMMLIVVVGIGIGVVGFIIPQLSGIEQFQIARTPHATDASTNVGGTRVSNFRRCGCCS